LKEHVSKGKKEYLLTSSKPQPVGMTARMQTIMSLIVKPATAIKTMTTVRIAMKIEPSINRNKSWKSALRRRLPRDKPCKNPILLSRAELWG